MGLTCLQIFRLEIVEYKLVDWFQYLNWIRCSHWKLRYGCGHWQVHFCQLESFYSFPRDPDLEFKKMTCLLKLTRACTWSLFIFDTAFNPAETLVDIWSLITDGRFFPVSTLWFGEDDEDSVTLGIASQISVNNFSTSTSSVHLNKCYNKMIIMILLSL